MSTRSLSEPAFTVVDKRGQCHIETEKPLIVEPEKPKTPTGSKRIWKSVGFIICIVPHPQMGPLIVGRGVGLREDGVCCIADYLFPPVWPEDTDWTKEVRKRLNTWLGCDCATGLPCEMHRREPAKWQQADFERLEKLKQRPLPEALEIMMRAEQARKSSAIVVPR